MKVWSWFVVAAVLAMLSAPPAVEARPPGTRTAVDAPRLAQSRACQDCATQRCGPPMQQCAQECDRPTIPARSAERLEQCRVACQDRLVACMATSCRACQNTVRATPGVRPFAPRIGPGGGEDGEAAPGAPAPRPRVVTLRRR